MAANERSTVPSSSAQAVDLAQTSITTDHGSVPGLNEEHIIEAESVNDSDDLDSTLGDDSASYTTSLKSAATNYIQENGRTYHGFKSEASYFLPNDEEELDRLDMYHHCLTLRAGGKLHWAPLGPDPHRILDLGTGTGIWAIEMGDKYPSAEVLGNDLSPVQPLDVPPNVQFEVDDMESEWVYSSKFDFIHGRYLTGSLRNWPRLLQQAFQFTKPGGWVEFQDLDMIFYTQTGTFKHECPAGVWGRNIADGVRTLGMEPAPGHQLEKWMKDAGFVNVSAHLLPMPLGPWPKDKLMKEIGTFDMLQFLDGLDAISLRIYTHVYKWEADEVRVFLSQVRKDMLNPRMHILHNYWIVYGQKPGQSA